MLIQEHTHVFSLEYVFAELVLFTLNVCVCLFAPSVCFVYTERVCVFCLRQVRVFVCIECVLLFHRVGDPSKKEKKRKK